MEFISIDFFWDYLDHVGGSVVTITHDFNQIDKYFTSVVLLAIASIFYGFSFCLSKGSLKRRWLSYEKTNYTNLNV